MVTSERHPGAPDNRRDNQWFSIKTSSLSLASRPEHEWTPMLLHPCERTLLRSPLASTWLHHHNQTRPATKTIMKLINGNVTAMS